MYNFFGFMRPTVILLFSVVCICFFEVGSRAQGPETISEVVYEMTPGTMGGYDMKIVFRRDGTALYNRLRDSKKEKLKGTISTDLFNQLAQFISERNFTSFKSSLVSSSIFTDGLPAVSPAIVTTTVVDNGKRKTVAYGIGAKVDSPEAPPKGLLEIGSAVMRVADHIEWTKIEK